jgi:hypothetical protein
MNHKMQKFIIIIFFFVLSLAGCSPCKKTAEKTALDYTLPAEMYKPRLAASAPATWKYEASIYCLSISKI